MENVCRNDIFDFAAYCFQKGIRLCSSRPTRQPIDAYGCSPFSGVFGIGVAASCFDLGHFLVCLGTSCSQSLNRLGGVREAGGSAWHHEILLRWWARQGAPALRGEGQPTECALRRGRYYRGLARQSGRLLLAAASLISFSVSQGSFCSLVASFVFSEI